MTPALGYTLDATLVELSLLYLLYIIYGRTTGKALIGKYKPGGAGYPIFKKLISNNKFLALTVISSAFFTTIAAIDGIRLLNQERDASALVIAPLLIGLCIFVLIIALPRLNNDR
jgi:hypothetical protein